MSMHPLGKKFTCYSCHTKFYDLGKPAPLCPKCGSDQRDADEKPATSSRGRRSAPVPVPPPPVEPDLADVDEGELGAADDAESDAAVEEEEFVGTPDVEAGEEEEEEDDDDEDEEY